ncbi:carboxylesterase family protein [Bradyrhizobium sp. B117]|uniref:carboxylesterase family protein n=1 Tax=Bradyrhizobium sp. B117 TaxID=3140246 RepID=UPI0031832D1C
MPVLDDTLVQRDPIESIRMGGAHWCDMMIGVTREEYAAFSISNPSLDELSEDALESLLRSHGGDDASATLARLRSARAPTTPRMILGDFYSERMFTRPSLEIAATQSGLGRKAFTYLFDWQAPVPGLGACHCIDLPFLFGNIDVWQAAAMVKGADRREVQDLSRLFRGSIAAFAAAGDPNVRGLPEWPAYTADQTVLHFDRRIAPSRYIA